MQFKYLHFTIIILLLAGLALSGLGLISFWIIPGLALLYVIFLITVSTNVRFNFFVKSLNSNPEIKKKQIALSFDDGPAEQSLAILEVLRRFETQAAFFCIGKNIKARPEIFQKIIAEGHIVGNHSFSHTRLMGALSRRQLIEEIKACNETAFEASGLNLRLFRPPFGIVSPKTRDALKATGMTSIGWSIRSFDAVLSSEEVIFKRVKKRIKPGAIILFHDNNEKTAVVLERLLLLLQEKKYEVVRPDKLLKINAYT